MSSHTKRKRTMNYDKDVMFKRKLKKIINDQFNYNMEEMECREWLSLLPEALRYVHRKIAIVNDRIRNIEIELEILESSIAESVREQNIGTATERKSIIESTYRLDPNYKKFYAEMYKYQKLLEDYQADLVNLNEKSWAIRKIADFEKVHCMYTEDE